MFELLTNSKPSDSRFITFYRATSNANWRAYLYNYPGPTNLRVDGRVVSGVARTITNKSGVYSNTLELSCQGNPTGIKIPTVHFHGIKLVYQKITRPNSTYFIIFFTGASKLPTTEGNYLLTIKR